MTAGPSITRLIVQTSAWLGFMGLVLFLPAGTSQWAQAWARRDGAVMRTAG